MFYENLVRGRSVVQSGDEEDLVDAVGAQVALDSGHQVGMIGGADAGARGLDDDVEPVVVEFLAGHV